MKITILGCHSATPKSNARPTAQILEMRGTLFLIDCGEGTQVALRGSGVKFAHIKHVLISHLHGDHFFGLPGLISTFQLLGRTTELHIYAPKGAKEAILLLLKLGGTWTSFPLIFHELESLNTELIFENEKLSVYTIPLSHRIYTNGFLFIEKQGQRKINVATVQQYKVPICYYQNIKDGKDVYIEETNTLIPNDLLSLPPAPIHSYAFCSDTAYYPNIVPIIQGVEVLYHEATFLTQHAYLAEKTAHSTAQQAAQIAQQAGVQTLILGHYSSRYNSKNEFKKEAESIFKNVMLAEDGKEFSFI